MKAASLLLAIPPLTLACGSSNPQYRTVDTPVGQTVQYGAPKNTTYTATAEVERSYVRLILREASECDRINVKIVRRVTELVDDDEIKHRSPPTNVQIAEGIAGTEPCAERFVRGNAQVSLKIGDQIHRLGTPNKRGELLVDLSERIGQDLYGKEMPSEAQVLVDGTPAGTISLAAVQAHEQRVRELLAELEALISTSQTKQSSREIAQAYGVYEQLVELAPRDARLRGLEARLLELVYERKSLEASEQLERDIEVLSKAKGLLAATPPGVPVYVRDAVLGGSIAGPALSWAGIAGALGLSRYPALCGGRSGTFKWSYLHSGSYPASTVVALSYLHYAYGDDYAGVLGRICRRFR